MSFEKKLAKAEKLWKQALKRKPDFENVVPDGTYTAKLVRAEMGESQNGRLQVAWRAVIASGEYKGENVNWWSGLETEDNIMYFQRDLVRLGKEAPEDPTEVESNLTDLEKEKPTIRLRVVTKGEYQNVRLLKTVEAEEEEIEEEIDDEEKGEESEKEESSEEESEEEDKEDKEEQETTEEESEEESEDVEEEAPEVEEGMRVQFSHKGKDIVGTVKKIDYKSEKVIVISDKGLKYTLEPDALSPAPTTKVKKAK